MRKVVAILGSPRKWGNTELLLEEFLKGLKRRNVKVKKIVASELKITPCNNCSRCLKTGKCVFKDDMDKVLKEFKEADYLVIASPVYFTNVPGQLKILIDRCQPLWASTYVLKKPPKVKNKRYGIFLSVCGYPQAKMFNCTLHMIKILFKSLGVEFYGKVIAPGVDKKGEILKREEILSKVRRLAEKLI